LTATTSIGKIAEHQFGEADGKYAAAYLNRSAGHSPTGRCMDLMLIISLVFVATLGLNLAHRHVHGGDRFLYVPSSGWCRHVFEVGVIATVVSALAALLGLFPSTVCAFIGFSFAASYELYAVWIRRAKKGDRYNTIEMLFVNRSN
jgi:hypothetical protein